MKIQQIFNYFLSSLLTRKFEKEIKLSYIDKKKFVLVTFTDKTKARFFIKYADKLVKGNQIQFKARKNRNWLNPIKKPELKVIKEALLDPVKGTLTINYASKFKQDEKGEFVFLPRCTFETKDEVYNEVMTKLYTNDHQDIEIDNILLGYGKINGTFVDKNGTLVIQSIQSFEPQLQNLSIDVDLKDIQFHLHTISCSTEHGTFHVSADQVPFEYSPGYSSIKHIYDGYKVVINAVLRKTGEVEKVDGKWKDIPIWIQDDATTWDFSSVDSDKINTKIAAYREKVLEYRKNIPSGLEFLQNDTMIRRRMKRYEEDIPLKGEGVRVNLYVSTEEKEYLKLLDKTKYSTEFQSFSSLKKQFKAIGKKVTNKELKDLFFHSGYDETIFKHLRNNAIETYVDNLSFIFKVPYKDHQKYVWEVPNRTLATYIFNDELETNQLFSRLKKTRRMDIRNNNDIQEALGFEGFIIHTTSEAWIDKLNQIFINSVDKR